MIVREMLNEIYLDWFNNFLTPDRFAEYYGLVSKEDAIKLIEVCRNIHEQIVELESEATGE